MLSNQSPVSDLTVAQLTDLIRQLLREELHPQRSLGSSPQAGLLTLAPLHVGGWPDSLKLLSREEYYDDER